MKIRMSVFGWGILALFLLLGTRSIVATPTAVDNATVISSSGRSDGTLGLSVDAQAGNVTLLLINETRSTLRWQGYYGNVTGAISLEDASGSKLYDWKITSPQGEIYASNGSSVTWANIKCVNFTANSTLERINLTILENKYNMSPNDRDGINETFNYTFNGSFSVGSITIDNTTNSKCPTTYTYVNGAEQQTRFAEVILTDNVSVIYTALIETDQTGFTGATYDFQMIVGENGDVTATTPYYFFVELS